MIKIGYKITQISTPKLSRAAYPVWDPFAQSILFVEFLSSGAQQIIHRYSYEDDAFYSASVSAALKSCSFIYPTNRRGFYVISNLQDVDLLCWNGESQRAQIVQKIVTVDPNNLENNLIGAVADPLGRLYVGTYSLKFCNTTALQSLYRYTVDGGLKLIAGGFYGTMGLVFSADGCKAYHLDFCSLQITEFDVDLRTGYLCEFGTPF